MEWILLAAGLAVYLALFEGVLLKTLFRNIKDDMQEKWKQTQLYKTWRIFSGGEKLYWKLAGMGFVFWITFLFALGSIAGLTKEPLFWSVGIMLYVAGTILCFLRYPEHVVYFFFRFIRTRKKGGNPYKQPHGKEKEQRAAHITKQLFDH